MNSKAFRSGHLGQIQSRASFLSTGQPPLPSTHLSEKSHGTAGAMKNDLGTQRWWTINEAADYLNFSVAFIRKRVRLREIPFTRVGSKALRFRKQDLDAWLEANNSGGKEASDGQ